jgi:hypothetical protein
VTLRMLLTLALILVAPAAAGTTVLRVDLEQLTHTSQWVLRAQVESVDNVDLRREGRNLVTDVHLTVLEIYKGVQVPARYTLRLPGGTGADGVSLRIPGIPTFKAGDDVVLFLEQTAVGHIPCGLGQGVWRVHKDAASQNWVRQSIGSVHLMERDSAGRLVEARPVLHSAATTLGELIGRIYAAQPSTITP